MSIVNEYAIYILIKLCTSGVKECHLEHPTYSVYIIVVYLNSLLFGMSQSHPLNAIFVTLHCFKSTTPLLGKSNKISIFKSKVNSQTHLAA